MTNGGRRRANCAARAPGIKRPHPPAPLSPKGEGEYLYGVVQRRRRALAWALPAWLALGVAAPMHPLAAWLETWFLAAPPADQRVLLVTIGAEDHRRLFEGRRPLDAQRVQALVQRILEGVPARLGVDLDTSSATFGPLRDALGDAALERIEPVGQQRAGREGEADEPGLRAACRPVGGQPLGECGAHAVLGSAKR